MSTSLTDPVSNYYDARSRLTNRSDSIGTVFYDFDANDNRIRVHEGTKTNSWTFDAYDRVATYRDSDGNLIQYRRDPNGNVTNLIYPGEKNVFYAFDGLNRLTNVTDWANRKTSFEYDLASRLKKITRHNGTVRTIEYDAAGEATNIWEATATGVPICVFKFGWNGAGRIDWEFIAPVPHTYNAPARAMVCDDDDRLTSLNSHAVVHDTNGNMTTGPLTNDTSSSFTYDVRNRLRSAGGVSYGYDPAGDRTAITNGTNITRFVINPESGLSQVLVRARNGVTNYYVYGVGLLYEVDTAGGTRVYHYDSRGSTVALTDGNGNVTDRAEYSAYGSLTYRAGVTETPFLFNGRYGVQTDTNGLLYMRARYYNPYICRFVNADPSGFGGGLNFYSYADGNPISMSDPTGLGAVGDNASFSWLPANTPANLQDPFGLTSGQSLTGGTIGAAGVLEQAGQVRYDYNAWVAQYVTDSGGYSPTRDAIRTYFNQPGSSTALSRGVAGMYRWEQSLSDVTPSLANPTVTAGAVNNAAAIARYGGQGLMVVGVGVSVYNISTASDPYRATVQNGSAIVGGTGGGMAGAAGGAFIGSFFGPGPGTAIGAVVGAIVGGGGGGMAGHALGTAAYDANYGPNSPWYP